MAKANSETVDTSEPATPPDAVRQARTRARQRLIGAVVLLGIGVVALPLVFESKPRPIPIDVPIDVAGKEAAPAANVAAVPAQRPAAQGSAGTEAATAAGPASAPTSVAAKAATGREATGSDVITESRSDAGRDVTPRLARSAPVASTSASAPKSVAALAPRTATAVRKPPETASSKSAAVDAERARALLEGRSVAATTSPYSTPSPADSAAAPGGQRFIVQVGAFADAAAAREMRQKVEKLGLKTYTQVANTASGSRIRVRVGPFASRDAADAALAKAKSAGLAAVVMTL